MTPSQSATSALSATLSATSALSATSSATSAENPGSTVISDSTPTEETSLEDWCASHTCEGCQLEEELRARGVEEELCEEFRRIAIRQRRTIVDASDIVRRIERRILASAFSAAQTSPVGLETGRTSPFEEALDDPAIVVQGPAEPATVERLLNLLATRGDCFADGQRGKPGLAKSDYPDF